jgi:hypothetical protein
VPVRSSARREKGGAAQHDQKVRAALGAYWLRDRPEPRRRIERQPWHGGCLVGGARASALAKKRNLAAIIPDVAGGSDLEGLPQGFLPLRSLERWLLIELCRPIATGVSHEPATNREIETAMFYAADRVKWILSGLMLRFGIADIPGDQGLYWPTSCSAEAFSGQKISCRPTILSRAETSRSSAVDSFGTPDDPMRYKNMRAAIDSIAARLDARHRPKPAAKLGGCREILGMPHEWIVLHFHTMAFVLNAVITECGSGRSALQRCREDDRSVKRQKNDTAVLSANIRSTHALDAS